MELDWREAPQVGHKSVTGSAGVCATLLFLSRFLRIFWGRCAQIHACTISDLVSSQTQCFNLTGTQSEFIINNTKAGPGALAVTIEGPSKVKMDCQEVPEGYKVQYTPMAPGNYLISIKYGGPNHITGSPFKARVTGNLYRSL